MPDISMYVDPKQDPRNMMLAAASGGTTSSTSGNTVQDMTANQNPLVAAGNPSDQIWKDAQAKPPAATETTSQADFKPENNDPRESYRWKDVKFPVDQNVRYETAQNDYDPNSLNELEKRVFTMDSMRAGADDDSSIAYIRVIAYQQGKIYTQKQIFPRVYGNSVDNTYNTYKKLIVSSISMNQVERQQIIKTNKALHAYFFNSAPEVIALQGFLKTTPDDPWDTAMVLLWDRLLRGTELALHHGIVELGIAETIYWGYPLVFSHQMQANTQFVASFAMQMLIIDRLHNTTNVDSRVDEQFLDTRANYAKANEMVFTDLEPDPVIKGYENITTFTPESISSIQTTNRPSDAELASLMPPQIINSATTGATSGN